MKGVYHEIAPNSTAHLPGLPAHLHKRHPVATAPDRMTLRLVAALKTSPCEIHGSEMDQCQARASPCYTLIRQPEVRLFPDITTHSGMVAAGPSAQHCQLKAESTKRCKSLLALRPGGYRSWLKPVAEPEPSVTV